MRKNRHIYQFFGYLMLLLLLLLSIQSYKNLQFVFDEINYLVQPYDLRGFAKGGIYAFGFLMSVVAIFCWILIKSKFLFKLFLSICSLFFLIDFFLQTIGGVRGFSTEEFAIGLSQFRLFKNLQIYLFEISLSFIFTLVVVASFYFIRRASIVRIKPYIGVIMLGIAIFVVSSSSKKIFSIQLNAFPSPVKVPAIVLSYYFLDPPAFKDFKRNLPDTIVLKKSLSSSNILWVIDESVTGSFLSVNGFPLKTTPFLEEVVRKGTNCRNYGVVNSMSNCSNYSNLFLRIGLHPGIKMDYQKAFDELPSVFQYAKRAGYKTLLMDSQITKGELPNFLTPEEMEFVDEVYSFERKVIPHERDWKMVDILARILDKEKDERYFIIFIKYGCHWPYLLNFDSGNLFFKPVQSSTATRMTLKNREVIVNTYLNSLRHNVDLFFEFFLSKVNLAENIVFYTSDHGQSILESETARTHCSNNIENIPVHEFDVPLLVMHEKIDELLPKSDTEGYYSQHQMVYTTLQIMGYDVSQLDLNSTPLNVPVSNVDRKSYITGTGKVFHFSLQE